VLLQNKRLSRLLVMVWGLTCFLSPIYQQKKLVPPGLPKFYIRLVHLVHIQHLSTFGGRQVMIMFVAVDSKRLTNAVVTRSSILDEVGSVISEGKLFLEAP
jgi:hypothetical protein